MILTDIFREGRERGGGGAYLTPELLDRLVDGDIPGQHVLAHQELQSETKQRCENFTNHASGKAEKVRMPARHVCLGMLYCRMARILVKSNGDLDVMGLHTHENPLCCSYYILVKSNAIREPLPR